MAREPTDEEYRAYDGMHCAGIWARTPESWACPVCGRTKRQILRWGERKGSNARIYGPVGWKAGLHRHHDHGWGRFPESTLCGACNYLDARLKRQLGIRGPFSFSPEEMRQCLTERVRPNTAIKQAGIDLDRARETAEALRALVRHH